MKGVKTIKLNGADVKVRLTLGVLEDFAELIGDEFGMDEALAKPKYMREILSLMSEYAGDKVDAKEFKMLDFSEMDAVTQLFSETMGNGAGKPIKDVK